MASTVAHRTALKNGQRIHANASDTAMTSSNKARSSRVRTRTPRHEHRNSQNVTGGPTTTPGEKRKFTTAHSAASSNANTARRTHVSYGSLADIRPASRLCPLCPQKQTCLARVQCPLNAKMDMEGTQLTAHCDGCAPYRRPICDEF